MKIIYTKDKFGSDSKTRGKAHAPRPSLETILIIKQFARTYSPNLKN